MCDFLSDVSCVAADGDREQGAWGRGRGQEAGEQGQGTHSDALFVDHPNNDFFNPFYYQKRSFSITH